MTGEHPCKERSRGVSACRLSMSQECTLAAREQTAFLSALYTAQLVAILLLHDAVSYGVLCAVLGFRL